MELEELYTLSSNFSPPEVDLRQAQILDDYGCEDYAKMPINHQKPDDVKREEFDYYGWIYPFVKPKDLLFYLYAVVKECQNDMNLDWLDSYMYSMDREINELMDILSEQERQTVRNAFKIIWNAGGENGAAWWQCKNLQQLIGVEVE